MIKEITLIDKGRGLQLSTSRITVMDLVQYFRRDWPYEEIVKIIPSLTREETAVVEAYYREHKEELDEKDRRIDEYREEQARLQAIRFPIPEETKEEKLARFRKLLKARQEKNGDGDSR